MLVDRLYYELNLETQTSEQGLNRLYSGMSSVLSTVVKWASLTGAVLAFSKAVNDAKNEFLAFEEGARRIWTLIDVGEEELRAYTGALLDLSTRVPQSIGTLEKAMYDAISSNIDLGDSMQFIEESSKGAIAGMTNVATAVDLNTTILNAYGMKVRDVADINDVLFTGVNKGKVTYEEFASSLGNIIPTGAALGVELESLISAIAAMTLGGMSADNTVTYLNQVLVSVLNPTKQARDEAAKYGVELSQTALQAKGLLPFLEDLKNRVGDNGEAMAMMFGNVRALRSVLSLTGPQLEDFNRIMGEMGERAGATEKAYEKMADSTINKVETLSNTWKSIGILMWEKVNPAFEDVVGVLNSLGLGIKSLIDDSYKLRDMFSDLDEEAKNLSLAIDDVGEKVANANSVVSLYSRELDRVAGEADDFNGALTELVTLIDEHNFAVQTGERDYTALRESINKLIDQNPQLIGMYEAEGDMLKLNIDLIKAEIDARIALMEVKKLELKDVIDQQSLEIDIQRDKLLKLGDTLDEAASRRDRLEPLRKGLAELYEQIEEVRDRGVFGEDAERESQRLLSFINDYGDALLREGVITENTLERLHERIRQVQKFITAEKTPFGRVEDTMDTMMQVYALLPREILTNFDSELKTLNKTILESEAAISKTKDEIELFTKKTDAASASISYTDLAIKAMAGVKDTIGAADTFWDDWFRKQEATFKRQLDSYKAMKDSQSKYDQEIAQQSFSGAVTTLKKIRQYAVAMNEETTAEWAANELRTLEEIGMLHQDTYDSIIARKKDQLNKELLLQKQHLEELRKVIGDSTDKYLLLELERKEKDYENLLRRAFGETADTSYLSQLQEFTGKTLDELIDDIETASNKLTSLRAQEEEATKRLTRAMQFGDLDEQISIMNRLSSISKEIAYTSTNAVEAFDAFGKSALWTARADLLKGDIDKVAKEYETLLKVLDEHTIAERFEEAAKTAQAIRSLALAQAEQLLGLGKDASKWIDVYKEMGTEIEKLRDLSKPVDRSYFERASVDLQEMMKTYNAIYSQYRASLMRGDTEYIASMEAVLESKQNEILSMLSTAYQKSGDYDIFKLLRESAEKFGISVETTLRKFDDKLQWEKDRLEEIANLDREISALTAKGYTGEVESKLRRLQSIYLELGINSALMGDLQNQYFEKFEEIQGRLNEKLKETNSFMDEFSKKKDLYYSTVAHSGEEAVVAGRAIAGEIAKLFERAYQDSVLAGKANEAFWKGFTFWTAKAKKETIDYSKSVETLREEYSELNRKLIEVQEQGLWDVSLKVIQDMKSVQAKLLEQTSEYVNEYQELYNLEVKIRDLKKAPPPDPKPDETIANLQARLAKERQILEEEKEERLRLERELEEKRKRIQKEEALSPEEVEASPRIKELKAEIDAAEALIRSRENRIKSTIQGLWEETRDPEYLREWIDLTKEVEDTTISMWERIKSQYEFMIADSSVLSSSAVDQWETLREMIGDLPKTGRASFVKDLFGVDQTEALQILKYIEKVESAATNEVIAGLDRVIKEEEAKSRERIQQAKGTIEQILGFEHMNQQQKINYLNMFGNVFKGSKEEELQVAEMIEKEKADLERELYEERKKAVIDEKEAESKARLETAEKEISEIASAERIGVMYRIRYLQNWMDFYEGTAEERMKLEKKVTDEILRLQARLNKELQSRVDAIPEDVLYKDRLAALEGFYDELLQYAKGNAEAEYSMLVEYTRLKDQIREKETARVRSYLEERLDLFSEMANDMTKALEEGGGEAGARFLKAMFDGAERIVQHYVKEYVIEPLLDEISKATAEFEEQGMSFTEALTQGISAGLTGNVPKLLMVALTFNLSQMKKQFEIFWESLKNAQVGWLQDMLKSIEWFLGGSKKAIEDLKRDIESALMKSDSLEAFGENLEETIKDRIKQGIITAFLETAAMKALFKKIADEMNEAMKDGEVTEEEWAKVKELIRTTIDTAKGVFENLPEDFWEDLPGASKPSNTVKSITEQTAKVLLAIERSSNLYLKEINETARGIKTILQGWDGHTPSRDSGFNTQQTLRSHGL